MKKRQYRAWILREQRKAQDAKDRFELVSTTLAVSQQLVSELQTKFNAMQAAYTLNVEDWRRVLKTANEERDEARKTSEVYAEHAIHLRDMADAGVKLAEKVVTYTYDDFDADFEASVVAGAKAIVAESKREGRDFTSVVSSIKALSDEVASLKQQNAELVRDREVQDSSIIALRHSHDDALILVSQVIAYWPQKTEWDIHWKAILDDLRRFYNGEPIQNREEQTVVEG